MQKVYSRKNPSPEINTSQKISFMIATYRLNANKLSEELLDTICKSFPDKEIEIIVLEQDADEYLRSSPKH